MLGAKSFLGRPGARLERRCTLYLLIGTQRLEWGLAAGRQWLPERSGELPLASPAGTAQALEALCAALPRAAQLANSGRAARPAPAGVALDGVRVLLADTWLAAAQVAWSPAMHRPPSAAAFARRQIAQAGWDPQLEDTLRLDEAPYGQARLAVVYPAVLLRALEALAAALDTRLASVLPVSAAAWGVFRSGRGSVLAVADRGLALLAQGGRRLQDLIVAQTGAADDPCLVLRTQWQRLRLRDPSHAGQARLALCDLSGQPAGPDLDGVDRLDWPDRASAGAVSPGLRLARLATSPRQALDAIQGRAATTPRQWLLIALTATLASAMLASAAQTALQVRAATAHRAAAAPRAAPPARPADWTREEAARVRAVNTAIRQLNVPIDALLRALQPPRDIRVAMLGLDLDETAGQSGAPASVRIVAEALSGADMARYVAFVAEQRPFVGAYLTGHEVTQTQPERPYRFTVEAAWAD